MRYFKAMKKTMDFLKKIKKNNNTEWMHAHKELYLGAKEEFAFLTQELITRMGEWETDLPFLEPKNCVFRFNRDIRFSNNKNPYKENFGAFMAYGGRKGGLPGYYFHVSPKEIFVAGGVWMPEPEQMKTIRREIMENGDELLKILNEKKFKKEFGKMDDEHKLKRPPKGFNPDNKYIELLKFKSFTISSQIPLEQAFRPGFGKLIDSKFKLMRPFNQFLNEAMKVSQ